MHLRLAPRRAFAESGAAGPQPSLFIDNLEPCGTATPGCSSTSSRQALIREAEDASLDGGFR